MANSAPAMKFDFTLEPLSEEASTSATTAGLKPGSSLNLVLLPEDRSFQCTTSEGGVLGAVPQQVARQLLSNCRPMVITAGVRSVKRKPGEQEVSGLQIRVAMLEPTSVSGAPGTEAPGSKDEPFKDPTGFTVDRAHLKLLAGSEDLKVTLKDERLQQVLLKIDAAPNRELALQNALQDKAFEQFAEKLKVTMQMPGIFSS